jgi:hypothetical protein
VSSDCHSPCSADCTSCYKLTATALRAHLALLAVHRVKLFSHSARHVHVELLRQVRNTHVFLGLNHLATIRIQPAHDDLQLSGLTCTVHTCYVRVMTRSATWYTLTVWPQVICSQHMMPQPAHDATAKALFPALDATARPLAAWSNWSWSCRHKVQHGCHQPVVRITLVVAWPPAAPPCRFQRVLCQHHECDTLTA